MRIERTQWPVGQGGMASGFIQEGDAKFFYLYDCGSQNQRAVRRSVNELRILGDRIDAIFISHLDHDHVSGLKHLLDSGRFEVDAIFLPYLSDVEAMLLLAAAELDGDLTWDFAEFLSDPGGWLREKGASRVYWIQASSSEDDSPIRDDRDPEPDLDFDEWRTLGESSERGSNGSVGIDISSRHSVTGDGAGDVIPGDAKLSVRLPSGARWGLFPFVPPLDMNHVAPFRNALKKKVGIDLDAGNLSTRDLIKIFKDDKQRKLLKEAYSVIPGSHNHVSMCLYSGPVRNYERGWVRRYFDWGHAYPWHYLQRWYVDEGVECLGWLGTGDTPLKHAGIYGAFRKKFEKYFENVGTLMCPHHGSKHSFEPDLLRELPRPLCFAPHGQSRPYGHPHDEVVRAVMVRGLPFVSVTDKSSSALREIICLE